MKPMNNGGKHKENGRESIIPETEKNVVSSGCSDIGNKRKEYLHRYHLKNKKLIHRRKREYYQRHKDRIRIKNRKNRSRRNKYNKQYYRRHKVKLNSYRAKYLGQRYKTDVLFRVKHLLRTRLGYLCKNKQMVKPSTMKMLGCGLMQLKSHLEKQFVRGMTWDNHGRVGWHIDHIIPLDTAKTEEDMKRLCHYKNLQPLWWYDNLSKGNTQKS